MSAFVGSASRGVLHSASRGLCLRGDLPPVGGVCLHLICMGGGGETPSGLPTGGTCIQGRGLSRSEDTWDSKGYCQQAGGTHPTVMFSCCQLFLLGWHVGGWHPIGMFSC